MSLCINRSFLSSLPSSRESETSTEKGYFTKNAVVRCITSFTSHLIHKISHFACQFFRKKEHRSYLSIYDTRISLDIYHHIAKYVTYRWHIEKFPASTRVQLINRDFDLAGYRYENSEEAHTYLSSLGPFVSKLKIYSGTVYGKEPSKIPQFVLSILGKDKPHVLDRLPRDLEKLYKTFSPCNAPLELSQFTNLTMLDVTAWGNTFSDNHTLACNTLPPTLSELRMKIFDDQANQDLSHLTHLNKLTIQCYDDPSQCIEKIPVSVSELTINNRHYDTVSLYLPSLSRLQNLTRLHISSHYRRDLTVEALPLSLQHLHIQNVLSILLHSDNEISKLQNLQSLELNVCDIKKYQFPEGTTVSLIKIFDSLPHSLEQLTLIFNNERRQVILCDDSKEQTKLRTVHLHNICISPNEFKKLPDSIEQLYLGEIYLKEGSTTNGLLSNLTKLTHLTIASRDPSVENTLLEHIPISIEMLCWNVPGISADFVKRLSLLPKLKILKLKFPADFPKDLRKLFPKSFKVSSLARLP